MRVYANVMLSQGFAHSLIARISENDSVASVLIYEDRNEIYTSLQNLTKTRIAGLSSAGRECLFAASAVKEAKQCSLVFRFTWFFWDPNDTAHSISVTLETILHDGSLYRKIIIPLQLEVLA